MTITATITTPNGEDDGPITVEVHTLGDDSVEIFLDPAQDRLSTIVTFTKEQAEDLILALAGAIKKIRS